MAKTRSKDFTAPNISQLEADKRRLLLSKENPERLAEIIAKLEYLYYGRLK